MLGAVALPLVSVTSSSVFFATSSTVNLFALMVLGAMALPLVSVNSSSVFFFEAYSKGV